MSTYGDETIEWLSSGSATAAFAGGFAALAFGLTCVRWLAAWMRKAV